MDSEAMDIADIIIGPSTDQKIKSRNAAMRLKHGSPHFKDVLRKRFRNRIKETRGRLFDRLRDVNGSQSGTVSAFIQQELASILKAEDWNVVDYEEEIRIREEAETDVIFEHESWLMQQYDLLVADDNTLQQLWEETQLVVCPVCRKGNLRLLSDAFSKTIHCDHCPMTVPARASIPEIQDRIYAIIGNHSDTGCLDETYFFVSTEDASLYAHCNACSFFDLTV